MAAAVDPFQWFMTVPVVSRCYLAATVATTAACFMGLVSPLNLYYNFDLIVTKGQYWRIFSSFFFFGPVGLDFVLHLYFVVNYVHIYQFKYQFFMHYVFSLGTVSFLKKEYSETDQPILF